VTTGWWAEHPIAQIRSAIVMTAANREASCLPLVDFICKTFLSGSDRKSVAPGGPRRKIEQLRR